jgi:hypothetical protein
MSLSVPKIRFDVSGYYFLGLAGLIVLGFWPSYFSKFFNGTNDYKFYFHFHALMMVLWLVALIIQPILIRKKKLPLHRLIGKATYFLFPLVIISITLLAHSRHTINEKDLGINLLVPFKDVIIMATAYFIAIRYRHQIDLHARGMVVTGIAFIEPALNRLLDNTLGPILTSYLVTIGIIYAILIGLIIRERHQKKGRWVFPLVLGLYVIMHAILIFDVHIAPWEAFARWFERWPIT